MILLCRLWADTLHESLNCCVLLCVDVLYFIYVALCFGIMLYLIYMDSPEFRFHVKRNLLSAS